MERIYVKDAEKFLEEVVFEVICTCNVDVLVISKNYVVELPRKYAGRRIEELAQELCGRCLYIDDGGKQYLIKFYTLKTELEIIGELLRMAAEIKGL